VVRALRQQLQQLSAGKGSTILIAGETGVGKSRLLRKSLNDLDDGSGLTERVAALTGGAPVKLALDDLEGEATMRLLLCLAEGGVCRRCHGRW
jgi:NADPH:quinone reductase-like Zn-dependent oxidoreductase